MLFKGVSDLSDRADIDFPADPGGKAKITRTAATAVKICFKILEEGSGDGAISLLPLRLLSTNIL